MKKTANPRKHISSAKKRDRKQIVAEVIMSDLPAPSGDFNLDDPLSIHPWDNHERLVASATGRMCVIGPEKNSGLLSYPPPDGPPDPGTVCFYPGGGGDWEPLVRFPKCKVFAYFDLALPESHGAKPMSEMAKSVTGSHPELKYVASSSFLNMSSEEDKFHDLMLAWERNAALYLAHLDALRPPLASERSFSEEFRTVISTYRSSDATKKRRTWVACFQRTLPDRTHDYISVVYLTVEGLAGYLNLFFANGIAPGVICLKPYEGFSCGQLSPKMLEAFGAVLKNDHAAHGSLLVVPPDRKANTPWMSDWSKVSRRFRRWGRAAYATKSG